MSLVSGSKTDITITAILGWNSGIRVTDESRSLPSLGKWQRATVVQIRRETATAKTFRMKLDHASDYLAGQHYVLRLTAPDGYTASRSYSVASAPDGSDEIELTVERLPEGEVSSFMHDDVVVGDELEVRGPIGGWFVWRGDTPALLLGGGSGVVPLMAMLRLAQRMGQSKLVHLIVSTRTHEDLYYADELANLSADVLYTRRTPKGWPRPAGRLAAADLPASTGAETTAFVCGSSGFSDAVTDTLLSVGVASERIRVERFGPTR
jgi:ferredoxin-NADP reductase